MSNNMQGKLKPKRHHGYAVVLFILGTLLPPLAVAARFGIGADFFTNLILTICGYIPGHVHNFYIQNIRNNKTHKRTPKWAQKFGLVDTSKLERNKKRSEWAYRYNDRLPESTLEGQELAEGEIASRADRADSLLEPDERRRNNGEQLWNPSEEHYYGRERNRNDSGSFDSGSNSANGGSGGGGRWRYPANFEDAEPGFYGDTGKYGDAPGAGSSKKKKKAKKDRWERTEDAYAAPEESRKKKKKKTKNRSTIGDGGGDYVNDYDRRSVSSLGDGASYPENPESGHYSSGKARNEDAEPVSTARRDPDEELHHEF